MTRRIRFCLLISFLVFGLVQTGPRQALARSFEVNKKGDHVAGACNAADCTLREAILAANDRDGADTIRLGKGTYLLNIQGAPDDDTGQVGDLDITGPLTITGDSAKDTFVEGAWGSRLHSIFHVVDGKATINNVTIRKGLRGIAVGSSGKLLLRHSALRNNGTNAVPGGGLLADGPATLTNVDVTGNRGDVGGGISSSANGLEVKKSLIANNRAADGGGVYHGGQAFLKNSVIRDNTATSSGGGIFSQGNLKLEKSTVEKNDAIRGGGIYSIWNHEISRSKINGNTAETNGGGIYDATAETKEGDVMRSLVKGNKAKSHGGGIYRIKSPLGGSVGDCGYTELGLVTLAGNRADSDHENGGDGGGLYATCKTVEIFVWRSVFKSNRGFNGGGVFVGGMLRFDYTTVAENEAEGHGGGLLMTGFGQLGFGQVYSSTFVKNSAALGGGGIAAHNAGAHPQGVDLFVDSSTITGNRAKGYGGGIDLFSGVEGHLDYLTVTNNRADSNGTGGEAGGGLQNGGAASVAVMGSLVSGNSVGDSGTSPDCAGTFDSHFDNLIGDIVGCIGFGEPGDKIGTDAGLLPLAWNGGLTRTHALKASSDAINSVPECGRQDQRGAPRHEPCDTGAYERAKCEGVLINVVGLEPGEHLTGTQQSDGIFGGGGDDVIKGLRGNDALCGSEGKDRLEGGGGNDRLNGGTEEDVCMGGPGSDFFKSCETQKEDAV